MWNATASLVTGGVVVRGGLRCGLARRPQRPRHAWRAPGRDALPVALRPGQVGRRAVASRDPERAVRISAELRDHEAAGSLAEELPYWGWLEDGRTCLTRTGELIAAGRLAPAVVDGRSPEQIDRVLGRWQRLLSGLDSDTRLYFYMLRRPSVPEATDDESSRHRSGLPAEAECVSGRPCAAARGLPGLVARSPSPHGRRRAQHREERPGSCSGGSAAEGAHPPTSLPRSRRPPPAFARRWTRAVHSWRSTRRSRCSSPPRRPGFSPSSSTVRA